jgi:phenylalanyl-tRNA synthetase alpha subunit
MKTIDSALQPIAGYLLSITRNTIDGWYEIEIGIPSSWVFDENDEIKCEILSKSDAGKLIKISPKNSDILIDDLVSFVQIIMETNKKIAEKEKQFTDKMEEMKMALEKEAKHFYTELDELKANSFKKINDTFVEQKKETRHRRTKAEMEAEKLANSITTNTSGATETKQQ